jgi:shikimate kinase
MTQIKSNIYLVGMPGSGKTTLGFKLSKLLAITFLDLDDLIEAKEQIDIPEIFRTKGETYFRKVEKELLHSSTNDYAVIATGGGTPCFFDNMEFINNNGISIWLDVKSEILAERVLKKAGSRPLLKDFHGKALLDELLVKYTDRKPYYEQSNIRFNPERHDVSDLLEQIKLFDTF